MIYPRLLSTALRKYTASPEERGASARLLALYGLRLCCAHLGRQEAAKVALYALGEPDFSAAETVGGVTS